MVKKSLIWVYRFTLALIWFTIIVLATAILSLRYLILPNIDQYKDQIAEKISVVTQQKVTIGHIRASWNGMNPQLDLRQVAIYDANDRMALTLHEIQTSVSWLSIPLMEPKLAQLAIQGPVVSIRRDTDGMIYIAGIQIAGSSEPELGNWVLRQSRIDIHDATVLWEDQLRGAPALMLNNLNLSIENPVLESLVGRHRFGLQATPSAGSSEPIDVRGNFYGKDIGKLDHWSGTLYARLDGTDIAVWRQWVDYPFKLQKGYGAARFWLDIDHGKPKTLTADIALQNVLGQLSEAAAEARLRHLAGRLSWKRHPDGQEIGVKNLHIANTESLSLDNGAFSVRERKVDQQTSYEGDVSLDAFDLEAANQIVSYLPIPEDTRVQLAEMAPEGQLRQFRLRWRGDGGLPTEYNIKSQLIDLGLQAYGQSPGFSHVNGHIEANEKRGTLNLNASQAVLDFKEVMRWPIPAGKLNGQVKWTHHVDSTDIKVTNLSISSAHLSGLINASYKHSAGKPGVLDLTGRFDRANAKYALFYYPTMLGKDTLHWLDTSILSGDVSDVSLIVKGRVDEFPFRDAKHGLFKVTGKVRNALLEYGTDWPRIEKLSADLLFQGERMEITTNSGEISGNKITQAKAVIPVLDADDPVLIVDGQAQGTLANGIRFINSSPVIEVTEGFTETLEATGDGKVTLQLQIPLEHVIDTRIKGSYQISNGSMRNPSMPDLQNINGTLEFTESGLSGKNISAVAMDGPARVDISTGKNRLIKLSARGNVSDAGLKKAFPNPLLDYASGKADWFADISIQQQLLEFSIRSPLTGMALALPAPLGKTADERMPLKIEKRQSVAQQDTLHISLANQVGARLQRIMKGNLLEIDRGEIGINVIPEIPEQPGLGIRGEFETLNLDPWLDVLRTAQSSNSPATTNQLNLERVRLKARELDIFERRLNQLSLNAVSQTDGWKVDIASREITGETRWVSAGNGKIQARLKSLIMPSKSPVQSEPKPDDDKSLEYPDLDIIAENFELGQTKLGNLELIASERDENWRIEKLKIANTESTLTANGEWYNWKRNPNTQMNMRWEVSDMGRMLERFGHPNMISKGTLNLDGRLQWPGSPHEFNVEQLSGNFSVDARKGQILKIQPGVGRLFSVLTLQNLPRRLTLDFRDLFSSGFPFDKITANADIKNGLLHSDDFLMEGPVAKVEMKGDTDLKKETQHLHVKVTPYISDSVSLAALAGGPALAAAAFVAQKLLKDPLNKIASGKYEIIGTWDNPVEVKSEKKEETSVKSIPGQ